MPNLKSMMVPPLVASAKTNVSASVPPWSSHTRAVDQDVVAFIAINAIKSYPAVDKVVAAPTMQLFVKEVAAQNEIAGPVPKVQNRSVGQHKPIRELNLIDGVPN